MNTIVSISHKAVNTDNFTAFDFIPESADYTAPEANNEAGTLKEHSLSFTITPLNPANTALLQALTKGVEQIQFTDADKQSIILGTAATRAKLSYQTQLASPTTTSGYTVSVSYLERL